MEFTTTPNRRGTGILAGATRPAGRKEVTRVSEAIVLLVVTLLLIVAVRR
jgi:predicted exporter